RGMARGAIVVILSDGWDRGEPDALAEQMARLSRVAHKIVWVNPLKASPGYAPLAQGMAAAVPYVDVFVEGHSLAALEELAEVIDGVGIGAKLLVQPDTEPVGTLGDPDLDRVVARDALGELAAGLSSTRHYGEHGEARGSAVSVFIESFVVPPRTIIFGTV